MNRREMFKYAAGSFIALSLPDIVIAKQPTWFTKKQLLCLFNQLDEQTTRETVDINELKNWNGEPLEPHEMLHLSIMRMSNIMHRRTLDSKSQYWIVVAPSMCDGDMWYPYQFSIYQGKYPNGKWIKKSWQSYIREEVSPGIYSIGNIGCKWNLYVCSEFPDNKIMLGMRYKEVINFRKQDWGEIPNYVPYMGKPTRNNYAIITLK